MPKPRSALRNSIEYAAVVALTSAFRAMPRSVAFWLTDRIGDLAYALDAKHRLVAIENVQRVFPDWSPREVRGAVRRVFRNFLRVAVELAILPDLLEKQGLRNVIEIVGEEHVRAAFASGKGVIVYSAHLGNWEAIAAAGEPLAMKLHSVGRALDNPRLDALLMTHRSRYARSVVPKEGGLRRIVKLLRDGCGVAMLVDQHAGRDGILVDFLGRPAATFRAPAEIAWKLGLPILGGFGIRVGPARFRLEFQEPLLPDPAGDRENEVRRLTQSMTDRIAVYVRRYPDQWNWLHRRWRDAKRAPAPAAPGVEDSVSRTSENRS